MYAAEKLIILIYEWHKCRLKDQHKRIIWTAWIKIFLSESANLTIFSQICSLSPSFTPFFL